jgi:hypothetical protein
MKVYPVRVTMTDSDGVEGKRVKGFSSATDARKYMKDMEKEDDEEILDVEFLDPVDFSLDKKGVLAAFDKGQELAE